MKRIKLLIFVILCLMFTSSVYALSASVRITGENNIKVGNSTTLYVRVDSSDPIRGADLTYSSSGDITITSVTPVNGMTTQYSSGNTMALYTSNSLKSGSSVVAIKVKGTKEGTGTVSITKLEASLNTSDGLKTAVAGSKSFQITVSPGKTQDEIDLENKQLEEEKAKQEEEKAKQEEENKVALNKATLLVEASERSVMQDDYEAALEATKKLDDSSSKTDLLNRLEEVRFNIAVKERCNACKTSTTKEEKIDVSNKWLIFNFGLLLIVIGEFIYIILNNKKNVEKEEEIFVEKVAPKKTTSTQVKKVSQTRSRSKK